MKNNKLLNIFNMLIVVIALSFLIACGKSDSITTGPTGFVDPATDEQAQSEDLQEDSTVSDDRNELQGEADSPGTEGSSQSLPLEVHFIDVGEADSALIICGDEAMLVDTGNPDQGTAIRLYMKKQKVDRLKYLLLTHSDRDHIGGAASVISNVGIDNLFMCRYEKDNEVYTNMINEIKYKNMSWSTPEVGSQYTLGDATITIIAPNKEYDNPNDSSIAFVIRHGTNSFIFTGDAEAPAESDIVNNGLDIAADVYYVGHHGSSTSSTQEFLNKVNPKYVVISCAKDNEYGHPHIETMDRLKAMGVALYRTDDQGTIICYSDGKELSFNTEPSTNWANGNSETNESASTQVKNGNAEESADIENGKNEEVTTQIDNGNAKTVEDNKTEEVTTQIDNGNAETVEDSKSTEITYVLNTNTKKFHRVGCDSVNDMKAKNRQDVSITRDEVVGLGYVPCKRCKP